MRHFTIILLALVLVLSCNTEEIWDQESKAQAYFSALFIVNREVVYNLDYLYEASTLMDAVQNNGDVETIMSRYFSMQDRISISYSPSDNSVKIDAGNKTLDIITGGKLLTASGAKWTVNGIYRRVWESKAQPESEPFTFTVENIGNRYLIKGQQVSNYLWEYYYTFSDLDLAFTTTPTIVHDEVSGDGHPDDRPMNIYIFNGTISTRTPDSDDGVASVPKFRFSTLQNVKGSNPYEYYQGEPIFIGKFFLSGKETATFGESNNADCFEADYSLYQAKLNGITYSL